MIPFVVLMESSTLKAWDGPSKWTEANASSEMQTKLFVKLLSVPLIGFINALSMFEVVRTSSSLTMAVLVALRQLITIFGGIGLFGDQWTWKAWLGLGLALVCMIEYARVRSASHTNEKKEEERQQFLSGGVEAALETAPLV